jgi:putative membrane protein
MPFTRIAFIIVLSSVSAVGFAQQPSGASQRPLAAEDSNKPLTPEEFVRQAATAGHAEVELGKLATQKASHAKVKAFAQAMVTDHTKANEQLASLAKSKRLELPDPTGLRQRVTDAKFKEQAPGKDFDRAFMARMVEDHEAAIALYQRAADDSRLDVDLRALAQSSLPTLEAHLKQAKQLVKAVGQ